MRKRNCFVFLGALALCFASAAQELRDIEWQTPGNAVNSAAASVESVVAGEQGRHVVLQFEQIPVQEEQDKLAADGVHLLTYLGSKAFFAKVDDGAVTANMSGVSAAASIQVDWKLHPMLARGEYPEFAYFNTSEIAKEDRASILSEDSPDKDILAVYIIFHPDVDLVNDGAAVIYGHGGTVRDTMDAINGAVAWIPASELASIASEDAVQWIEPPLPPLDTTNAENRVITQTDTVNAAPYSLNGSGINVLVYDGGYARQTHTDFSGRLTQRDTSVLSDHSTHVAGTIGGDGTTTLANRGMAPGVTMQSYGFEYDGTGVFLYTNPGDMNSDYNAAVNTHGAVLTNNSIGTNTAPNGFPCSYEGDYGATSMLIDSIVRGSLGAPLRVIWANGNERQGAQRCGSTYFTTAPPACAKNHITVGALNSNDDSVTGFTSWGPTDDGRMKPDISGPGCQSNGDFGVTSTGSASDTAYAVKCGTSMAAPTVTGLAALILQDFKVQWPGANLPLNSTLKTLFAHNAVDLFNTGPDNQTGYGSVRVQDTIDFMRTGNFFENTITHGVTNYYFVNVPPATPFLKGTMAWDDPPGALNTVPELVNDLDIIAVAPDGTIHHPWTLDPANPGNAAAQTGPNRRDNIEQVYVPAPATGLWRIEVHGYGVPMGPQVFSLCVTPDVADCTSKGFIGLSKNIFGCPEVGQVRVADCDLNTTGSKDTVMVNVSSTSEPAGQMFTLNETGNSTGVFRVNLPMSETGGPGILKVQNGDTVTATYNDANDGSGPATVTDTALIDCRAPVIYNFNVTNVNASSGTATIGYNTNEPTQSKVSLGTSMGGPFTLATYGFVDMSQGFSLNLSGLGAGTYYAKIEAWDASGKPAQPYIGMIDMGVQAVAQDAFDSDPGWTTTGDWAFGVPAGLSGDPSSGFTGTNVYGYNLNGDYPNSLAEMPLTSTAFNCTGYENISLDFYRWLGVESSTWDHAKVQVSNNGSTWTDVWVHSGSTINESAWSHQIYDISAVADNQATVYLRWVMGATDSSVVYHGWNIDDIALKGSTIGAGGVDRLPPALSIGPPSRWYANSTHQVFFDVVYDGTSSVTLTPADVTLLKTGTANADVFVTGSGSSQRKVRLLNLTGEGTLGVSLAPHTGSDAAGNYVPGVASSALCTVDNTPPEIYIGPSPLAVTDTIPVTYNVWYSGAYGIPLSLPDVHMSTTGSATATVGVLGAGRYQRKVRFTGLGGNGRIGFTIDPLTAYDLAGNLAVGSGSPDTFRVDNNPPTGPGTTPPAVTIGPPTWWNANIGKIVKYTILYRDASNITLGSMGVNIHPTGTATPGFVGVSGSGSLQRKVTLMNIAGNGTLGISINPGTASNVYGLADGTPYGPLVEIDNTPPEVYISAPNLLSTTAGPIVFTLLFSDAHFVTLGPGDVALNTTGTANAALITVQGAGRYKRKVILDSLSGTGTLGISLPAGIAVDAAGNPSMATGPSVTSEVTP